MNFGVTEASPRGTGGTKGPVAGMKFPAWGTAKTVLPPNIAAAFYGYANSIRA